MAPGRGEGTRRTLPPARALEGRSPGLRGAVLRLRSRDLHAARGRGVARAALPGPVRLAGGGPAHPAGCCAATDIRASFFVPAVVAPAPSRRAAPRGRRRPRARHARLDPRDDELSSPRTVERDLMRRAHETLAKIAGAARRRVCASPSWDFSPTTLGLIRELGLALRLVADGRRRALRDPGGRRADGDRRATGGVDQGRRALLSG